MLGRSSKLDIKPSTQQSGARQLCNVRSKRATLQCFTASAVPKLHAATQIYSSSNTNQSSSCTSSTSEPISSSSSTSSRRAAFLSAFGITALALLPSAANAETFLSSTGGKGILAEEEARLFELRQELEGAARTSIMKELENDYKAQGAGKLCATPFGVDIVGITEFILLVGAFVGGAVARQRKQEMEKLNDQLRTINISLRQQARSGTVYAPGLTYAPAVTLPTVAELTRMPAVLTRIPTPPIISTQQPATMTAPPKGSVDVNSLVSMEEDEMSADQLSCREALRAGKKFLKEQNGAAAMVRFEKALMLSKALEERVQERRAMRGLAASARLTKQYAMAIKHLERVLAISQEMQEYTGDADAYGTIADCYTDLGEFEKAAQFYDKYIDRMNREGPV